MKEMEKNVESRDILEALKELRHKITTLTHQILNHCNYLSDRLKFIKTSEEKRADYELYNDCLIKKIDSKKEEKKVCEEELKNSKGIHFSKKIKLKSQIKSLEDYVQNLTNCYNENANSIKEIEKSVTAEKVDLKKIYAPNIKRHYDQLVECVSSYNDLLDKYSKTVGVDFKKINQEILKDEIKSIFIKLVDDVSDENIREVIEATKKNAYVCDIESCN